MTIPEALEAELRSEVEKTDSVQDQFSQDRVEGDPEDTRTADEGQVGEGEDTEPKQQREPRGTNHVGGEEFVDSGPEDNPYDDIEEDEEENDTEVTFIDDDAGPGDGSGKPGDYLLQKAVEAGMSLENAKSFQTEDSLLQIVGHLEGQQQEFARIQEEQAVAAKGSETEKKGILDALPKLNPDDHDAELIQSFEGMKSVIENQQEQLKELKLTQNLQAEQGQRADVAAVEQWLDGQVKALGEEFTDALGEGAGRSLTTGSSQAVKRDEIAQQMTIQLAGYKAMGMEPPPREQVFDSAVKVVLPKERTRSTRRNLGEKLKTRSGQHLNRVSGNRTKQTMTPEAAAAAAIDKKYGD